VQLTGQTAPPNAKRVRFELEILGQHITYNADAAPSLKYHYEWDGKDGYGRAWQGPAPIRYRVGYVYDGWYSHTEVFGAYGQVDATQWAPAPDSGVALGKGVTPEDDLPRRETTMWMSWQNATVGAFDASQLGFGGFTLSQHHTYDPESRTLFLGTGDRRHAGSSRDVVRALIGAVGGTSDKSGDPRHTDLEAPHGMVVAPDGTIYVAGETQHQIFKLGTDGKIQVIAGTGVAGHSGDAGPATQATLNLPLGLALGKDGSLYVGERGNSVVRRINPAGVIETFAGGGKPTNGNGDGANASKAILGEPHSVAIGSDGSLFIVDATKNNIRRVRPDGVIETVLGSASGASGSTGDGGSGTKALLNNPLGIALGADGSLYVTEYEGQRVRRLTPDGLVSTVAGVVTAGDSGDGGLATAAQLHGPHSVDLAPDGSLYITDELNHRIRVITPDGIIHPLTGGGSEQPDEYVPAQDAAFDVPRLVTIEPSGRVRANCRLQRKHDLSACAIPSEH
jgi:streptogramin lyase